MKNADEIINAHPAASPLRRLFPPSGAVALPGGPAAAPTGFKSSGLTRADYLPLLAGNVDFFKAQQSAAGAIIDPYMHAERQYATPAFALAAATLVTVAGRNDLLEPATRALSFAIAALANHTTADGLADFYIPMVMHARRLLAERVPAATRATSDQQLMSLVPEKTYHDPGAGGNWNIVNVSGECLRRKDGLVAPDQAAAQAAYIERCLAKQEARYTKFGMYEDPNAPLAYDAFPRLWLEDMMADEVYQGAHAARLREFLDLGSLSTLLLLSPSGEWAEGGRSAQHQWNEAEVAVISEVAARRWAARGRPDIAGAFKRAAHLALTSIRRWQRPSGELWIVKNHADPTLRHGFEGYSFHSQYNLLAVAMLAIAYSRADDAIAEYPTPAESGGYVFDLRDVFHKVVAAAGGTYVLIDTGADPHYNSTGLLRVHAAGVPISPYSDNPAAHRAYGPPADKTDVAMSPGLVWKTTADGPWRSLADFTGASFADKAQPLVARTADLTVTTETPSRVQFTVRYNLEGAGAAPVSEEYTVTHGGIDVTSRLGGPAPAATRFLFPVLVSDGATDTHIFVDGSHCEFDHFGYRLTLAVTQPAALKLALEGPRVATHNGFVRALAADLPAGTIEVHWSLRFMDKRWGVINPTSGLLLQNSGL